MASPGNESDAIVLGYKDHGESDKIVTFYSKKSGRFTGIAKGANRSKKRFVNKLEIFSYLHIYYQEPRGKGLAFIKEADLINSFLTLRQNYKLYTIGSVIQELLLVTIDEKEQDPKLFLLSLWALHSLDQKKPAVPTLIFFLIRFFDVLGYRPDLSACLSCGIDTSNKSYFAFDYSASGLICERCGNQHHRSLTRLSPGTIKVLNSILDQPLERLHRLNLSGKLLQEAEDLLYRYGRILFQRDFQAWKTLNNMQREYRSAGK